MMIKALQPQFEGYWRHTVGTKQKSTPAQDLKAIDTWLYTDMRDPKYKKHPKPTWLAVANRSAQMAERVLSNLESEQKAPRAFAFFRAFQQAAQTMRDQLRRNPHAEYSMDWYNTVLQPFKKQLEQIRPLSLILDLKGHPAAFEQVFNQQQATKPKGR